MNIVIADDEQIIIRWLKKCIGELSPEYHIVEACMNGKQVLNCCLNEQVDVLFTDIRMPVMDGLELLEKLRANRVLPYTVVLSAYSDFSYVRDAFKLGAVEYLLKSEITKENVKNCLEIAAARLTQSRERSEDAAVSEDAMTQFLRQYLLEPAQDPEGLQQYETEFSERYGGRFMVTLWYSCHKVFHTGQMNELMELLFQENDIPFQGVARNETEIVLISGLPEDDMERFCLNMQECLISFGLKETAVCVSEAGSMLRELPDRYEQIRRMEAAQRFYDRPGAITHRQFAEKQKKAEEILERKGQELLAEMEAGSREQLKKRSEELLHFAQEYLMISDKLKQLLMDILMNIYWNFVGKTQKSKPVISNFLALNDASGLQTLGELFFEQILQMKSLIEENSSRQLYRAPVQNVIAYINENYGHDISLDDLSHYAHLNRSYLSTLFKKEVGVNINTYILNCRLEKAKELLKDPDTLVQQICDEVGIPDSAYFSKQFKRYTGESPVEYRRTHK